MAIIHEFQVADSDGTTLAKVSANNAAAANALHVLPGRATASAPSYSEGNVAFLSFDLAGSLRISGGAGGTSMTDDAAFTPASTAITPMGGFFDDVTPDSVDEGDGGVVRMSANRNLYIRIRDNAGNERGANVDASGNLNTIAVGGKTSNGAVPGADNLGALTGIATAAAPTYTEGRMVGLSTDLSGSLRVSGGGGGTEYTEDVAAPAAAVGKSQLLERDDALSAVTPIEGDWINWLGTSRGAAWITNDPTNIAASGALGALNNAVTIRTEGMGGLAWEIDTGTLVGTVLMEATLDDTNWFTVNVVELDGTISSSLTSFGKRGHAQTVAFSQMRLRVSAYTSGTSNARLEASERGNIIRVGQALPPGTNNIGDVDVLTVPAPLNVSGGGTEATALRVTIATDSTGLLSVDDNGGTLTVDNAALSVTGGGVEATALRVTLANDSTGLISVDDNGGSITVDNTTLSVVGGGVEATALRVTLASDSTGLVSVDDNGGSLTIDGSVSVTGSVDTELPAAAALADAASATPTTPTVGAVPLLMNATTIDRQLAVVNALDSVGT